MPETLGNCSAVSYQGKIFVIGQQSQDGEGKIFVFDPITNQWSEKADMLMSGYGVRVSLVVLDGRIWVFSQDGVVSYDPLSDSWRTEASLNINRQHAAVWAHRGKIYVLGGRTWRDFVTKYNTIEMYDPAPVSYTHLTLPTILRV